MRLTAGIQNAPQILFTALLVGLLSPALASAEPPPTLLQQGESAAVAGQCEEALSLLDRARSADPGNARAALITGQCQIRLKQYKAAEQTLEDAKGMSGALPETDLYLGMARYHQEDFAGAEQALELALVALPERAEVHFYLGLIALQRGESARAATALARAGSADPSAVEPIASFYQGLALEAEGQRMAAAVALQRAQKYGQGTVWADQAAAALERLGTERPPPWKLASGRELEILSERSQPWWVTVMAGGEYDSNVGLRGDEIRIGLPEQDDDDFRFVYSLEAGYEIVATQDWTFGVMATYYGTAHESLQDFDTHYPGVSTWLDRRINETTTARVQYDFSYDFYGDAWVGDSKRFLISHTWTPAFYHSWESIGDSRVFARFIKHDFYFDNDDLPSGTEAGPGGEPAPGPGSSCGSGVTFCGPFGLDERDARDRGGWGVSSGFDHTLPILEDKLIVRGGYRYHYYDADGSDFSYKGHELQLGGEIMLGHQFRFEGFASYTFLNYDNATSFPDSKSVTPGIEYSLSSKDRDDDLLRLDAVIDRPINDKMTVSARYSFFNSASNADTFDYDRHVVGLYATIRFSP